MSNFKAPDVPRSEKRRCFHSGDSENTAPARENAIVSSLEHTVDSETRLTSAFLALGQNEQAPVALKCVRFAQKFREYSLDDLYWVGN